MTKNILLSIIYSYPFDFFNVKFEFMIGGNIKYSIFLYFANCSYLIELLAKEGFVVVLVPYNVTFDHSLVAKQVYDKFHTCLDTILTNGLPQANLSPAQLEDLPIFSVGHR
jgi:hypothetical protein